MDSDKQQREQREKLVLATTAAVLVMGLAFALASCGFFP